MPKTLGMCITSSSSLWRLRLMALHQTIGNMHEDNSRICMSSFNSHRYLMLLLCCLLSRCYIAGS
jgi:hypothetical protein